MSRATGARVGRPPRPPHPIEIVGDGTARLVLVAGRGHSLIDEADAPLLEGLHFYLKLDSKGLCRYVGTSRKDDSGIWRAVAVHKILMPGAPEIDHVNGDGLDNRRANLRLASHAENTRNRGACRTGRSGFKGVSFHRCTGKYQARITFDGNLLALGVYTTPREAAMAYDRAARALHGRFARPNFARAA